MRHKPGALIIAAACGVALTACSSSGTSSGSATTPPAATAAATSSAPRIGPTFATNVPAPVSTAPAGTAAAPGLPAVTNGTDLTKQPTVAAGTGAAPTGVVVRDLVAGTGTAATTASTVNVKYVGTLYSNGTIFDASWGKGDGDAASFALSGVIPGFAQGLVGMNVGSRREIVIPAGLGYGASATGSIPANSTLVFVVDMVSVT